MATHPQAWKFHRAAIMRALSVLLRTRREELGLPIAAFALRAAISEANVRMIEYGKRQPTLAVFVQLAQALELDPSALLQTLLHRLKEGVSSTDGLEPRGHHAAP